MENLSHISVQNLTLKLDVTYWKITRAGIWTNLVEYMGWWWTISGR